MSENEDIKAVVSILSRIPPKSLRIVFSFVRKYLSTVRIEPKVIARILGVRVDTLINNSEPKEKEEEDG